MKFMLVVAIVLMWTSVPSQGEVWDLTRAQQQAIARILSQSILDSDLSSQRQLYPLGSRLESGDPAQPAASVMDELFARKRGLDLGMGRGFSGNQQGKSQVGLIAANMARGPGRR